MPAYVLVGKAVIEQTEQRDANSSLDTTRKLITSC